MRSSLLRSDPRSDIHKSLRSVCACWPPPQTFSLPGERGRKNLISWDWAHKQVEIITVRENNCFFILLKDHFEIDSAEKACNWKDVICSIPMSQERNNSVFTAFRKSFY